MADDALKGIDDAVAALIAAGWKERDDLKAALIERALAMEDRDAVKSRIEAERGKLTDLELRWELDEVLEALEPEPEAPEEEEEEEDAGPRASDFVLVYDDPRGLQLFRTKTGDQWCANQADPRTGQPQSFAVPPEQVAALKQQLKGSPYWVLGAGEVPV